MKTKSSRRLLTIKAKNFIDKLIYRIDLDADYQREKIWSRSDQETLLDSIIKDIDIPKLYLAKTKDEESFDYECIDGKQRMTTLLEFFKPETSDDSPLCVKVAGEKYTYKQLQRDLPKLAKKIEDFKLTLVIYPKMEDELFIREIFRRLQLGVRLNSGEMLKSYTGNLRDFVFKEMGKTAPFLSKTNLSEKRFSREFTLAQICRNSFSRAADGEFVRARFDDLEDFFKENEKLPRDDGNLERIRKVLKLMDDGFGAKAFAISSRAVAVTAYLYVEEMHERKKAGLVGRFAQFYIDLLAAIDEELERLTQYEPVENQVILEGFQKYISQASVEPYAIKRRHEFAEKAFEYYSNKDTAGRIIGSRR